MKNITNNTKDTNDSKSSEIEDDFYVTISVESAAPVTITAEEED